MKILRDHIVFRLIWVLMAMHVFNYSIALNDTNANVITKDLTYNNIENIAKLLVKNVFQFENAIGKHKAKNNSEANDLQSEIEIEIDFFQKNKQARKNIAFKELHISYFKPFNKKYHPLFHIEIIPPPPKV